MQVATHITLGTVEIVSTNGGWTTIRKDDTESKVRNGTLADIRTVTDHKQAAELPVGRKNGVVDPLYLPQYQIAKVERAGRVVRVVDSGDALAIALREKTLDDVYALVASRLSVTVESLKDKYAHLNLGMQRMSLGNVIRRLDREANAK